MSDSLGAPRCPACTASACVAWAEKQGHQLWRCTSCGTVFAAPDPDALRGIYDHYYETVGFDVPAVTVETLDRLVASCERFRRTGRWLDIGFGAGALLQAAERRGWQCHGTEVAPDALTRAAQRGWTVTHDPAGDARFPERGFDVVTLIELIEHVPSPRAVLQKAASYVREGGLLYLTTPNGSSLNRRLLGTSWSAFCPPDHLTIWTARALRDALCAAGLRPTEVRAEGFNPWDLLSRWRSGGAPDHSQRNEAAVSLNTALSRGPGRRALKRWINRGLSTSRLGDTLKVSAVRDPA